MNKLFQGMIHCGRYDQTLTSPVICVDVPIGLHCDYTIDQTLISVLKAMGNQHIWNQMEAIGTNQKLANKCQFYETNQSQ